MNHFSIFSLLLIGGLIVVGTSVTNPQEAFSELFSGMEIYTETFGLPETFLQTDEIFMLFDTTNIANMSKVTVTANLPCSSSDDPRFKVAVGTLGNSTNIIDSSLQSLNYTGPLGSCTYSGTVKAADENITIQRVWLTPNNGTNISHTFFGNLVTLTALLDDGNTSSVPVTCGDGHTDNGDGTCTFTTVGTVLHPSMGSSCTTGPVFGLDRHGHASVSCYRTVVYWDIESIDDDVTISDVDIQYDIDEINVGGNDCDFYSYESNTPSTDTVQVAYDDAGDGTNFVTDTTNCKVVGTNYNLDLGDDANSDLQAELAIDNEWSIGITSTDEQSPHTGSHWSSFDTTTFELQVTYTP